MVLGSTVGDSRPSNVLPVLDGDDNRDSVIGGTRSALPLLGQLLEPA